jgi:hypothetical protein
MSKQSLPLLLLAASLAGCSAGATTVFRGNYPVMLGPKDRVRATTPLPTTKLGDYVGGAYKSENFDGQVATNENLSSLEVEAERLVWSYPDRDLRVERIEPEAWSTLFNAATTAQVMVYGQAVQMGGK